MLVAFSRSLPNNIYYLVEKKEEQYEETSDEVGGVIGGDKKGV